jgi:hypothetical protein
MTPDGDGRVCDKCQNTVVDFRKMTPAEIVAYRADAKGPVCGIYSKSQLRSDDGPPRKNRKLQAFLVGIFGLFANTQADAQQQSTPPRVVQTDSDLRNDSIRAHRNVNTSVDTSITEPTFITGSIRQITGEPVSNATILIKGTKSGTTSDQQGIYSLDVTNAIDTMPSITLAFVRLGFLPTQLTFTQEQINDKNLPGHVMLFRQPEFIAGRLPLHKRIWNGIKRPFTKKEKQH